MNSPEYVQLGRNLWRPLEDMSFNTRFGAVLVPSTFEHDLFSVVSNTDYPEWWPSATLHDWTRKNRKALGWTRSMCDIVFRDEMTLRSFLVYQRLLATGTTKDKALDVLWGLLRRANAYYRGVAGVLGTFWIWVHGA